MMAIDPGSSSGAIVEHFDGKVYCRNMPPTLEGMNIFFGGRCRPAYIGSVYVENVGGSMPGNAAKAARTFATHMGHLEALLLVYGFHMVKVVPRKWMDQLAKDAGVDFPKGMENKAARKQLIYEAVQKLYPGVTVTKRQSDALGIYHWATKQETV